MKKYLFAILALFTFACGSVDEGAPQGDAGDEIGTAEEGISAPSSPSLGFGAANSLSHAACLGANASATQQCLVPVKRSYTYCLEGNTPFTAAEVANIKGAVFEVENQSNFAFSYVLASQGVPNCVADVVFNRLSCSGTCNSTGTIDNCVCSNPTVGVLLTESLPGTYSKMLGSTIHLDRADVDANFGIGTTQSGQVEVHGFAHQLALLQGAGARTTASQFNSFISGTGVVPFTAHTTFSSGEFCKMQAFSTGSPSTFNYSGTCPQD
jgi:hypothetical protein